MQGQHDGQVDQLAAVVGWRRPHAVTRGGPITSTVTDGGVTARRVGLGVAFGQGLGY